MCCSSAWRTHFTHMQTLTVVAKSMQSQQFGGMWMSAQNLRVQSLMMKMTSHGPLSNPWCRKYHFGSSQSESRTCNRLPICGMRPYVALFIWLHAVSSGVTEGFILLWSHMQKHSSRPVNTLKSVRLVELPFKCADISSQIRDTFLQFDFTNLPSSLHITTSTFVTDCGLFDLK